MFNYNKRNMTILSFIIAIIIYIFIHIILNSNKIYQKKNDEILNLVQETSQLKSIIFENESPLNEIYLNKYNEYNWRIVISKINLDAPILEGTSKEVLRKGVGHFEETSKWQGNVCLAAHNRGYKYNYFQELKRLEMGDIIIYKTEKGSKSYIVDYKEIIKETDLSKIKETKDNCLTLITCAENLPEYRLCIQAKEII